MRQHIGGVNPELLPLSKDALYLAQRFLDANLLSSRRLDDVRHVACAIAHQRDVLVNWNYRYIANVRKAEAFRAVAALEGFRSSLEIHTSLEIVEWT
ncbi:MAG: hypothetical protein BroJett003_09160 [Planctomycetota bacterium]|nr:MAG: hypothetical protein BroJett003_09160 [Planctomycetota bacterium]